MSNFPGQAASIKRMCITPEELQYQIGKFGHYCPVCLVQESHLVDCSGTSDVTCHAAEYRGYYYIMCEKRHLEVGDPSLLTKLYANNVLIILLYVF